MPATEVADRGEVLVEGLGVNAQRERLIRAQVILHSSIKTRMPCFVAAMRKDEEVVDKFVW